MNALELFRSGLDTAEIAEVLCVNQSVAEKMLHEQRSASMGLPAQYLRRGLIVTVQARAA